MSLDLSTEGPGGRPDRGETCGEVPHPMNLGPAAERQSYVRGRLVEVGRLGAPVRGRRLLVANGRSPAGGHAGAVMPRRSRTMGHRSAVPRRGSPHRGRMNVSLDGGTCAGSEEGSEGAGSTDPVA